MPLNQKQYVLGSYTLKDIKEKNYITLKCPLTDTEISNLKYLNDNTTLNLSLTKEHVTDEANYLLNIIKIFEELVKYNYTYNIIINITNRELLRLSRLISKKPANVILEINTDDYVYSLNEYMKDEKKLESLIAPIRESNLSPLEKHLAVYDIVKNYKPYKKNEIDRKKDRELRYILDDNNPYIVCSGFARLLNELLRRVNINSKNIETSVDFSDKITPMPIKPQYIKHARNIIKIDDSKYDIHGYYLADSTWDNHPEWNLYLNSILTFDRKKEARHLESLEDDDLLFDFHNLNDFTNKIQYFIKRRMKYPNIDTETEDQLRIKTYKELYKKIMDNLFLLDRPMYKELYDKYHEYFTINSNEVTSNKLEISLTNFLTDYAKYIIPLSNNKIDISIIIQALVEVKRKVYHWSDDEIRDWLNKTVSDNNKASEEAFPYIYNPNGKTEGYLKERPKLNR